MFIRTRLRSGFLLPIFFTACQANKKGAEAPLIKINLYADFLVKRHFYNAHRSYLLIDWSNESTLEID
jgi:hypothetical protein